MLPDINVALPVIFVFWCLAAVVAIGPVMLAYPLMWGVIGLLFFVLGKVLAGSAGSREG